jgi:hypothetical protein
MCRWLERDPAGYQDGPSLYSYLGRNPMAGTDPYGLSFWGDQYDYWFGDRHGEAERTLRENQRLVERHLQEQRRLGVISDRRYLEQSVAMRRDIDSVLTEMCLISWEQQERKLETYVAITITMLPVGEVVVGARALGAATVRTGTVATETAAAATTARGLATGTDEAVFWSGLGRDGAQKAADWSARNGGGKTLELTLSDRGMRLPAWDPTNPASVAAWREASIEFAAGARGNVRVLQGDTLRVDSIWRLEFGALRANPSVLSIRSVHPSTGAEVILWAR